MSVDERSDNQAKGIESDLGDVDIAVLSERDEIVVQESGVAKRYPWPQDVIRTSYGDPNYKPSRVFRSLLATIRRFRPQYQWIPFYKDESGANSIRLQTALMDSLNSLFYDQLSSDFSVVQRTLLEESDVVIVCYDPEVDTILSYGSTRFSLRGSIEGIKEQVSHAGHMIVAVGHEKKQLAPLTAVLMNIYGHTAADLFRDEVIVLRTNNRYVERLFGRVPPVYRSDRLLENETDYQKKTIVAAMKWTNLNVFHADEDLKMGQPISIKHRFPEHATIDGVGTDEIIYIARMSSIGYYLLRILKSVVQRNKRQ